MFTITFYSYKGGVGRTSALMNVAHRLCSMGKRVCVLDFDLEAPGLDAFDSGECLTPRVGLVEYISSFIKTGILPNLSEYICEISSIMGAGKLFLMPAGRKDASYQAQLSRLDWKILYKKQRGFLLMEAMKSAIESEFQLDYLLIDSRTGLTDISGICTLQLPDLVVLLFGLNEQNIRGTAQVYKTIVNNKLKRGVQTLLVASPIPDVPQSYVLRTERFEKARQIIGAATEIVLPYDPFMCFEETIVIASQSTRLSKSYDALTKKLVEQNVGDVINLLRHAGELREAGDMALADIKYREILESHPKSAEVWMEYGRFSRIVQNLPRAEECFSMVSSLTPQSSVALAELAITQLQNENVDGAREHFSQFVTTSNSYADLMKYSKIFDDKNQRQFALEGYHKASMISPDLLAVTSKAEAYLALHQYEEAFEAYKLALEQAPNMLHIVFNGAFAATKSGNPDSKNLLLKSVEIFESMEKKPSAPKDTANIFSAIAYAYYELGQKEKALSLLENSLAVASRLQAGTIFSFPEYEWVSPQKFIERVMPRLEQLRNELS